jgi:hypothetical protein
VLYWLYWRYERYSVMEADMVTLLTFDGVEDVEVDDGDE